MRQRRLSWPTPYRAAIITAIVLCVAAGAFAQGRRFFFGPRGPLRVRPNTKYDGRFTFVRVKYETAPGGYWYRGLPAWAHGYPLAERNLMRILNEISFLGAHEDINVLGLDDPELMKYPVAYIIEVSWWTLSDREAAGLRAFIQKGGFLIVDDFKATGDFGSRGWEPFEENMERVLPGIRFVDLNVSDPIFHCFFDIDSLESFPQAYNAGPPIFRGV